MTKRADLDNSMNTAELQKLVAELTRSTKELRTSTAELRASQQETERQMKETDRKMQETDQIRFEKESDRHAHRNVLWVLKCEDGITGIANSKSFRPRNF